MNEDEGRKRKGDREVNRGDKSPKNDKPNDFTFK